MIFYRVKETSRYLLKDELYTDSEVAKYNIDSSLLSREEYSKTHTIRVNGHRFALILAPEQEN